MYIRTRYSNLRANRASEQARHLGEIMDGTGAQQARHCAGSGQSDRAHSKIFRPIQYLGSKLRVVNEIVLLAQQASSSGARIADLFCGSSVVSQAFATKGFHVTAVDAQQYAVVIARACLGVERIADEKFEPQSMLESPRTALFFGGEIWSGNAEREARCLSTSDTGTLRSLYEMLPLIWRGSDSPYYDLLRKDDHDSAFEKLPLITSMYSGNYFGIQQALNLDTIRHQIEMGARRGTLSNWQQAAALTSLFHAASRCVHSAGKHFAQPMSASGRAPTTFNDRRLLEDRQISVKRCFIDAANRINDLVMEMPGDQRAILGQAERIEKSVLDECEIVYLDPPYTAQQYSRFYHVLETLLNYNFPKLVEDGQVTKGIYPSARYKSAFCSKAKAGPAMQELLSSVYSSGASAIVSYSHSEGGSDGNSRMISFDDLIRMCKNTFGFNRVECVELDHTYRQFNSAAFANEKRKDPEILILCKTA